MNMNGLLLTLLKLVSCCTPADLGCLGDGWVVQVWWLTFFCVHLETKEKKKLKRKRFLLCAIVHDDRGHLGHDAGALVGGALGGGALGGGALGGGVLGGGVLGGHSPSRHADHAQIEVASSARHARLVVVVSAALVAAPLGDGRRRQWVATGTHQLLTTRGWTVTLRPGLLRRTTGTYGRHPEPPHHR